LEAECILPVYPSAYGFGGLPIRKSFGELHQRNQRQPPRRDGGPSAHLEEIGEVLICVDGAKHVPHVHVEVAFGEGGFGDTGGVFRDGSVWDA
jgi:hypothetical protein